VDFYKKLPRYFALISLMHWAAGHSCAHFALHVTSHSTCMATHGFPASRSDLTEATLAGASISLVAAGFIILLIILVRRACRSRMAAAQSITH
jgi:hypothetical protein